MNIFTKFIKKLLSIGKPSPTIDGTPIKTILRNNIESSELEEIDIAPKKVKASPKPKRKTPAKPKKSNEN